jgi:broad specificity phosphatase PhoE
MSEVTARLWLVRHASVAHGDGIYGQTDLSCDCPETALFTSLAEKLPSAAVWVASNLRRTHETASAIIRAGLPGPKPIPGPGVIEMADLAEQHFGEWQGLTYERLRQSRAGDFHHFWHAPAHEAAPGGESVLAVIERVSRAIHLLVDAPPGATSSLSRMAGRSALPWRWRWASTPRLLSLSRSRIALSPRSIGSTAPGRGMAGA